MEPIHSLYCEEGNCICYEELENIIMQQEKKNEYLECEGK